MKKAILTNRIYLTADTEFQAELDQKLTYTIPAYRFDIPPEVIKTMARVNSSLASIPIGRLDLIPEDYEIIDKRLKNAVKFPEFRLELRESQKEIFRQVDDNCMINAFTSWGKTFTAIAIAANLKQKTLVVTHTVALRNQWAKEIKKTLGFEPDIIGSGKFGTSTPIVVGNVQTLNKKVSEIEEIFGTIMIDECHHISSPTFSKIIDKMKARYKIGLSGTLKRKDGKHIIFKDYFGNIVFQPKKENFMVPSIVRVHSDVRFPDSASIPWALRVNQIAFDTEYQHMVSQLASVYAAKGHRVLVVSDRVSFLKSCSELCGDNATSITGDLGQEEREEEMSKIKSGEKEILFGTQSIFSEGISLNELSCLILGTPINNEPLLIQLMGRVIRVCDNKLDPIIVDIQLKGKTAARQAESRLGTYISQGYRLKNIS
jgi:superfamily II DNA or RNA helicase